MIGQETTSRSLKKAIRTGQVAQAYLLAGPHGVGKTTFARVLAAALNCPSRSAEGEPCGECTSCEKIMRGSETMDVVEMDAASNRGVEDARELRQQAMYAPSEEGRWKVYIIDEAHMLTRDAWNALLKVLEEPPARTVFVFATTEPEKVKSVAAPVLSRVVRYDLNRITPNDAMRHLRAVANQEGIRITDEALLSIAENTKGAMRDALRDLDDLRTFAGAAEEIDAKTVRERFGFSPELYQILTLDTLIQQNRARVFNLVHRIHEEGLDYYKYFHSWMKTLYDLLMLQEGVTPQGWSADGLARLEERKGKMTADEITECVKMAIRTSEDFQGDNPPQIVFTTYFQDAISTLARMRSPGTPN